MATSMPGPLTSGVSGAEMRMLRRQTVTNRPCSGNSRNNFHLFGFLSTFFLIRSPNFSSQSNPSCFYRLVTGKKGEETTVTFEARNKTFAFQASLGFLEASKL